MNTTKEKQVHISDLHSDHTLWITTLDFCKQEITILEHRMEEIAKRRSIINCSPTTLGPARKGRRSKSSIAN